ncbi:MAG: hypothetical protein KDK70_10275 [Myxococcales bacterium]|nr:hypothetical protein [Myxococcales bacterium]
MPRDHSPSTWAPLRNDLGLERRHGHHGHHARPVPLALASRRKERAA